MSDETYSDRRCKWCGAPAETHVNVTDITEYPHRDYKEYMCERCQDIANRIYAGMEIRCVDVEIDELARRMKRALRRRGIVPALKGGSDGK